jgi:hypothetical protein
MPRCAGPRRRTRAFVAVLAAALAFGSVVIAAPAQATSIDLMGFTYATAEGQHVTLATASDVAFGGNGRFAFKFGVTVGIDCTVAAFGFDPLPSGTKNCYTRQTTAPPPIGQGLSAQPERRFIWVGTDNGKQFTNKDFAYLANNFDVVTFAKFHDGWNIQGSHEAAKRLVAMNPSIKVMPYFNMLYWFENNNWGTAPDPSWFVRNPDGTILHRTTVWRGENERADVVDLANPAYRDWAIGVLRSWLQAAPYAGISFDETMPIIDNTPRGSNFSISQALGPAKLQAYNDGMRDLLSRAHELVGPDRELSYNGITYSRYRPDRNLGLLDLSDGVLSEHFCLDRNGNVASLQDDLDLMASTSKKLYLRTGFTGATDTASFAKSARFCFGAFMLGWRPGQDFYELGSDYTADQLGNDPQIEKLNLGEPLGNYRVDGVVAMRDFTNGTVIVNLGDQDSVTTISASGIWLGGPLGGRAVKAGDQINVPAQDAVFVENSV